VTVYGRLLVQALDRGGGRSGVHVRSIEVTGLTLYHPLVPSDGHVLVVHHLRPGNTLLHPLDLELILLPLGNEVID
jgi:hypothetical protein